MVYLHISYGYFVCAQRLYQFGARKVIVTAVGQIGCIPYELARYNNRNNSTGRCNDKINNAIALFNSQLKKLVDRFNNGQLQGAKFVYLDTYKSTSDLAANGAAYGEFYIKFIHNPIH